MITANGVYLDIKESTFSYSYLDFKFYFSSEFNKTRFITKLKTYINEEESKIKNRYQISKINLHLFFAVALYLKIEKRGFKIIDIINDIVYYEKEDIKFIVKTKE